MSQTVLVVDDERHIVQLVKLYLTNEGYQVEVAHDGQEALDKVRLVRPDLIVLDLMLPWVNGIEVLSTVRQQPHLVGVPVLVTTGTATSAFDLRYFGHLYVRRKPLDMDVLVATLRKLMETSAS
jgi:DNA-binding response OmpR family regulator